MQTPRHRPFDPDHDHKPRFRLLPIAIALSVGVLIIKLFHIPAHIQQWRANHAQHSSPLLMQATLTSPPTASEASLTPPNKPQTSSLKVTELTEEEIQVLMNLSKERHQLLEEKAHLKQKEIALQEIEKKIADQTSKIQQAQDRSRQKAAETHDAQDKVMQTLIKTYETMKPKVAAQLLQEMDTALVIKIVSQLKPAKLTAIMTAMDPQAARQLTRKLTEVGMDLPAASPKARRASP